MASKAQRQHRIARLLEEHPIGSQIQIVELLADEGVAVNSATVSRDLEELGAIKVRIPGGGPVYAVPDLPRDQ
ncbi:MAG: ArgR family transcriptional regulator, partial [Actinomycetota bacterium]